jgi:bacterioferritin
MQSTRNEVAASPAVAVTGIVGRPADNRINTPPTKPQERAMTTTDRPFLTDIQELRRRARIEMDQGAVTPAYALDINKAIDVLNKVLASEIVCVLRYKRHFFMAKGLNAEPIAAEFNQHAADEQLHVDQVAMRITQLGGAPNFNPEGLLTRSVAEYQEGHDLVSMIEEDLVAERVVIMWYAEIAHWFGDGDITTRRMMEQLLAQEEEHANDLADLLADLSHHA